MRSALLYASIAGFLVGVFFRSFCTLGAPFAAFLFILSAALFFLMLAERRKVTALMAVALFFAGIGIIRMEVSIPQVSSELRAREGSEVTVEGSVMREPDARENATRLFVSLRSLVVDEKVVPLPGRVLVIASPNAEVSYGDSVRVTGLLRAPQTFESGEGRFFDYPAFLAKDGITHELAYAEVESAGEERGNPIRAGALYVKSAYLNGLRATLPEPHAALAGGITAGDKRSIGNELSEDFQTTGLTHIVVLSGYNISIVLDGLTRVSLHFSRTAALFSGPVVVLFFILISGGAAASVRAGAMALIAIFARRSGRVFLPLRVLLVVCTVMVLFDPYILAFDPGFQLSALATAGLILLSPIFEKKLAFLTNSWKLREIAAGTAGAQIAVLPLLLFQSGQLPMYSLFANLLALIAVPFAMAASAIAAVGGMMLGAYALPLALPAYILLSYIIGVANFLAAVPYASIAVPSFSGMLLLIVYVILFGVALYVYKKRTAGPAGVRPS